MNTREIRRRAKQARDPRRYVIQDEIGLFYNASLDEWSLRPEAATLFRRRETAEAVRSAISVPGERMKILQARERKDGQVLIRGMPRRGA